MLSPCYLPIVLLPLKSHRFHIDKFCNVLLLCAVSAEDAATRSRVQHIQAMLEQRAERRRARRLAKTAGGGQPYVLPASKQPKQSSTKSLNDNKTLESKTNETSTPTTEKVPAKECAKESASSSVPNQHLMRELLKGCNSASESNINEDPSSMESYSGAAHLQRDLPSSLSETSTCVSTMEVDQLEDSNSSPSLNVVRESPSDMNVTESPSEETTLKLPQEPSPQQQQQQQPPQQQEQQPQQDSQQKQSSNQEQESTESGDPDQQDTAKLVSLNSGTVVA